MPGPYVTPRAGAGALDRRRLTAALGRVRAVLDGALRGLLGMRPRPVVTPRADRPVRVRRETSAVVVGGGIAGVSAALVLAERGVRVTLLEAAEQLGGRLGAWPLTLPDGDGRSRSSTASTASSGSTTPGGRCCAGSTRSSGSCGRCRATR